MIKQHKILTGQTLADGVTIHELLGAGGMGVTYRAYQSALSRDLCIKFLLPKLIADPVAFERFKREAIALSSLKHPGIVACYYFGMFEKINPYLALEFAKGKSLNALLAEQKRLDWRTACELVAQACEAMEFAHQNGFVHRDLKPDNLMYDADSGQVKILDFGLIAIMDADAEKLTSTGMVVGSVRYMAPERFSGTVGVRPEINQSCDIYALGCILYELITGEVAFNGNSEQEIMLRHFQQPMPRLPTDGMPDATRRCLDAIIEQATSKDVSDRLKSCEQFAQDLRRLLNTGESEKSTVPGILQRQQALKMKQFMRRHSDKFATGVLVTLALSAVGVLVFAAFKPTHSPRRTGDPAPTSDASKYQNLANQISQHTGPGVDIQTQKAYLRGLKPYLSQVMASPEGQSVLSNYVQSANYCGLKDDPDAGIAKLFQQNSWRYSKPDVLAQTMMNIVQLENFSNNTSVARQLLMDWYQKNRYTELKRSELLYQLTSLMSSLGMPREAQEILDAAAKKAADANSSARVATIDVHRLFISMESGEQKKFLKQASNVYEELISTVPHGEPEKVELQSAQNMYIMTMLIMSERLLSSNRAESKSLIDLAHAMLLHTSFAQSAQEWIVYFRKSESHDLAKRSLPEIKQFCKACLESKKPQLTLRLVFAKFELGRALWLTGSKTQSTAEYQDAAVLLEKDLASIQPLTLSGSFAELYVGWLSEAQLLTKYPDLVTQLRTKRVQAGAS
jgi:serine/threonine protein kinase